MPMSQSPTLALQSWIIAREGRARLNRAGIGGAGRHSSDREQGKLRRHVASLLQRSPVTCRRRPAATDHGQGERALLFTAFGLADTPACPTQDSYKLRA